MVEIYNNAGTESYGCFDKLQSAGSVFANLAARGVQSVTVSSFHGRNLMRVYRVLIGERCRIVRMPALPPAPTPAA